MLSINKTHNVAYKTAGPWFDTQFQINCLLMYWGSMRVLRLKWQPTKKGIVTPQHKQYLMQRVYKCWKIHTSNLIVRKQSLHCFSSPPILSNQLKLSQRADICLRLSCRILKIFEIEKKTAALQFMYLCPTFFIFVCDKYYIVTWILSDFAVKSFDAHGSRIVFKDI